MIVEPIKAKKYVQFVANLLHCLEKSKVNDGQDKIDKALNDLKSAYNLQEFNSQGQIKNELVNELGAIPNRVEFLIENAFAYDAYSFIEELQNDNINLVMQLVFLCMIHALDMLIIYYSTESKNLRQYEIMFSNNSFDSGSGANNEDKLNHSYFVLLNPDGTYNILNSKGDSSSNINIVNKAHSFQMTSPNDNVPKINPLHMTFDETSSNKNFNQLNLTQANTYQNLNNSMMPPTMPNNQFLQNRVNFQPQFPGFMPGRTNMSEDLGYKPTNPSMPMQLNYGNNSIASSQNMPPNVEYLPKPNVHPFYPPKDRKLKISF